MMNRRSAPVSLSLLSLLCACGASSVRPGDDGAASADASADGASSSLCAAPIALIDAPATEVERVAFARAGDGFVMVTAAPGGALQAQVLDGRWRRAGAPVSLQSVPSNSRYSLDSLTVHVDGARAAIAYGTTVHELSLDAAGALSVARTMQTEGSTASVLGAWPRVDDLGRERLTVITDDASVWYAAPSGLFRSYASEMGQSLVLASPVLHALEDRYVAYERMVRRDVNNQVRVRPFVLGHGVALSSQERVEVGTLVGDPVALGDRVLRLHFRVGVAGESSSFSLVRDRREDGVELSRAQIDERYRVFDAQIAVRPGDSPADDLHLFWVRSGEEDGRSRIVAQRGERGSPAVLHESTQGIGLSGAWLDADGARGWIVYGEYDSSAPRWSRYFARCVER